MLRFIYIPLVKDLLTWSPVTRRFECLLVFSPYELLRKSYIYIYIYVCVCVCVCILYNVYMKSYMFIHMCIHIWCVYIYNIINFYFILEYH